MANYYEILNVDSNATPEEIKDAYRVMAMKWHPDRNINNRAVAEEKFKKIGAAYKILSDPAQRLEYDQWLAAQNEKSSANNFNKAEDISGKDAQSLFFESMLDLAAELARRGYDINAITKALISLDCPESVAKVAAISAVKFAKKESPKSSNQSQKQTIPDIFTVENAKWSEIQPYYLACIAGIYAEDRMNETEYTKLLRQDKNQMIGYLISFILIITGFIVVIIVHLQAFGMGLGILGILAICGIIARRIYTSDKRFNREKTLRYYQKAFEYYHSGKRLPFKFQSWNVYAFAFNIYWLVYRRMSVVAIVGILVVFLFTLLNYLNVIPKVEQGVIWYIFAISIGTIANKLYFNNCKSKIKKHLHLPHEQSLAILRNSGGTCSLVSAGTFLILFLIIISAMIQLEINSESAGQNTQTIGEVKNQKLAPEPVILNNLANDSENQKLDIVINELEATYPELNEKSPKFNQKIVDEVISRQNTYIKQGQPASAALRSAVADMTRPSAPAQNSY